MKPDELLHELESLTHNARMFRLVEVGRLATLDPSAAATIDALDRGGFYHRWLALQSCHGSRNSVGVVKALSDPSRIVRALAIALLPQLGNDAQIQAALDTATFKQRRSILAKLAKRRRYQVIAVFLQTLANKGDKQLLRLLPFGSPDVVTRHLDLMLHAGYDDWYRLARLHPDIVVHVLQTRAEVATKIDRQLVWQANTVLPILAEFCPERSLTLVGTLARHIPLVQLSLQRLAELHPTEVAELLDLEDNARISFNRVAHKLDSRLLLALLDRHPNTLSSKQIWFKRLTPAQRIVVYDKCERRWRDRDGCLEHWLIALLPSTLRQQEGEYHLALPALATRPTQRLPYASYLPWNQACTILEPFIRNPDADLRAVALSALVFAVRFQRDRLPDLLSIIRARRNEQDPVRGAMLTGLANLPPGIWHQPHLEDLSQIIRDALDAADLSSTTAHAAEQLIVKLLPFHPAWAAAWLATLVQERGIVSSFRLENHLSDADVRRIAPVLLPVLQAWETREREPYIIAVAQSLGRRLRVFEALVDILERILNNTRSTWIPSGILGLIAEHRRDRIPSLILELVNRDPSWVTQPVVYTYLHRCRQDLLTPFLGQQAYSGRFSTGKTRFVLPLAYGFHRWTPTQQAIFAATLSQVAGDSVRDSPAIIYSITQLARLPAIAPTRLIELATDPRQAVRDTALRALGKLDGGQGIPILLEALEDDRARIAIYALRSSLLEMPVNQALALLRQVSPNKVTVAKEVIRLLGELPSDSAYQELLALDSRELHRDVRVALLRALWSHLERMETWSILERAAVSPDATLATTVGRIPVEGRSPATQRRLVALLATLLTHPEPKVRLDVLQRCVQLPVSDTEQLLLPRLLEAMGSLLPDESAAAASAVFATYSGDNAYLVGAAVKRLLANRRSLLTTVQALQTALTWNRRHLLPTARAVLEAMTSDRLTASLRVELAVQALPWDEIIALLIQLTKSGEMHPGVLATAIQAIHGSSRRSDTDGLRQLEVALSYSEDEQLRRLALAALVAQSHNGWDDELLKRLQSYRSDSAPLVAAAAQFTLPPIETQISNKGK